MLDRQRHDAGTTTRCKKRSLQKQYASHHSRNVNLSKQDDPSLVWSERPTSTNLLCWFVGEFVSWVPRPLTFWGRRGTASIRSSSTKPSDSCCGGQGPGSLQNFCMSIIWCCLPIFSCAFLLSFSPGLIMGGWYLISHLFVSLVRTIPTGL